MPVKIAFALWQGHLQAFFMGLLFFLAGIFAHRSLSRRGARAFLAERSMRLEAFEAAVKTAKDFGWDGVVPNMVYVWTGLAQAIGLRYYGIPGIHIPHTIGFNYIEPPEDLAWMRADEYDALIDDSTAFLYNVWLPRVSAEVSKLGEPSTYRNKLSFVKGGMAMPQYFYAFQVYRKLHDKFALSGGIPNELLSF